MGPAGDHAAQTSQRARRRQARKLRAFYGSTGGDWERAAGALEFMRSNGETHDWWDAAAPRRR